jgi:hypothetical protein
MKNFKILVQKLKVFKNTTPRYRILRDLNALVEVLWNLTKH